MTDDTDAHPLDVALGAAMALRDAMLDEARVPDCSDPSGPGAVDQTSDAYRLAEAIQLLINQVEPRPMDSAPRDPQLVRLRVKRSKRWRIGYWREGESLATGRKVDLWEVSGFANDQTAGAFDGWLPIDPWCRGVTDGRDVFL
jgi:hypothetical protein